jgi:hypothetical protein
MIGGHLMIEAAMTNLPTNRPASWNATMISGERLITDEQFERLLANAPKDPSEMEDHDPVPVVKIFLPHLRWVLGWIYPTDLDRAFAVVQLGNDEPEAGDVLLSDIVASRLGGEDGMRPERDKYTKLDQPLSHYLLHAKQL